MGVHRTLTKRSPTPATAGTRVLHTTLTKNNNLRGVVAVAAGQRRVTQRLTSFACGLLSSIPLTFQSPNWKQKQKYPDKTDTKAFKMGTCPP